MPSNEGIASLFGELRISGPLRLTDHVPRGGISYIFLIFVSEARLCLLCITQKIVARKEAYADLIIVEEVRGFAADE